MIGRTFPRAPGFEAESCEAKLARPDKKQRLNDSHRRDRSGFPPGPVDLETRIRPSRDPDHTVPGEGRFPRVEFGSQQAKVGWRAMLPRWRNDRPRKPYALASWTQGLHRGLPHFE